MQRWLGKNRFCVSQASVVQEVKKIHEVMFQLIAEVTAGDKFIPFLIDASAQLLHPRTCAYMYILSSAGACFRVCALTYSVKRFCTWSVPSFSRLLISPSDNL